MEQRKVKRMKLINRILVLSLASSLVSNGVLFGLTLKNIGSTDSSNITDFSNITYSSNITGVSNITDSSNITDFAYSLNITDPTKLAIAELPYNNTCLLDSSFGLVKEHIYAHICYNPWLHTSIIDLRFEKDGQITMEKLKSVNFTEINGDWTTA